MDLVATSTNNLAGWQVAVPITHYGVRTHLWKLGVPIHIGQYKTEAFGFAGEAGLVAVSWIQRPGHRELGLFRLLVRNPPRGV